MVDLQCLSLEGLLTGLRISCLRAVYLDPDSHEVSLLFVTNLNYCLTELDRLDC